MFMSRYEASLVAFVLMVSSGVADAAAAKSAVIQRKFEPGGKRYLEEVSTIVQKSPGGAAGTTNTTMVQTVGFWEEIKKGEKDSALVAMTFDRYQQDITLPHGGEYTYDTDRPAASSSSPRLKPAFDAVIGQTITLEFGPEGEVRSVGGVEALYGQLEKCGADTAVLFELDRELNEEALRLNWGTSRMSCYARRSVDIGETWTGKTRRGLRMGAMVYDLTYKLEEIKLREGREVAIVSLKGNASSESPEDSVVALIAPKLSGEIVGEAIYDIAAGLFIEQNSKASLVFEISRPGVEAKTKMEAEVKTTTRYLTAEERERQKKEAAAKDLRMGDATSKNAKNAKDGKSESSDKDRPSATDEPKKDSSAGNGEDKPEKSTAAGKK